MNLEKTKSLFLKSMIGCLVAAAVLAVATILAGQFNDVSARALFTIVLVAIHCLVSFGFILNNEKQETFESLSIFANATFILIILSFMTSVLGVWGIVPGWLVAKLYAVYFVLLFAILHGETLAKTLGKQHNIDLIVHWNYVFMAVVVILIMPVIFMADQDLLTPFYYRFLAACGIIDATLTLVAVILHKLYLQKHPKLVDNIFSIQPVPGQPGSTQYVQVQNAPGQPKRGTNIFVFILIAYLAVQFAAGIILGILGTLHR
jgi:phosphatidylserine synthase